VADKKIITIVKITSLQEAVSIEGEESKQPLVQQPLFTVLLDGVVAVIRQKTAKEGGWNNVAEFLPCKNS
jgi:hypothetical protein